MQRKNIVRLAIICLWLLVLLCWLYPSYLVYRDYSALLDHAPTVKISVLNLWMPFGAFGVVISLLLLTPKAIIHGKKMNEIHSSKMLQLTNKTCVIFVLVGIVFTIGWTYHSLDLLDKYGYEYSGKLTKVTPTGIHLIYVKSKN